MRPIASCPSRIAVVRCVARPPRGRRIASPRPSHFCEQAPDLNEAKLTAARTEGLKAAEEAAAAAGVPSTLCTTLVCPNGMLGPKVWKMDVVAGCTTLVFGSLTARSLRARFPSS